MKVITIFIVIVILLSVTFSIAYGISYGYAEGIYSDEGELIGVEDYTLMMSRYPTGEEIIINKPTPNYFKGDSGG